MPAFFTTALHSMFFPLGIVVLIGVLWLSGVLSMRNTNKGGAKESKKD
jgi:hypothetical protein